MSDSAPGTGHRMEFRATTQVGENLNTEGETWDSVKVCSGDFVKKCAHQMYSLVLGRD